ncbi:hypothetical protein TRFO_38611 [Tritrichomonas foetus]|uniref:NAD-dependent epimerase/dehydratase domain-containing protein n=1 Tax=Tritrichomonas foetus TaxID=1144522 RepID=A0A1J4J9G3_9EUKA|nr:hypothetical protein TRFO_38611 [Tritrichomonas foetus]|eukprot:OHS95297.1 hypothetical protein TRFO_38611 [Tritrichomonas foetus]
MKNGKLLEIERYLKRTVIYNLPLFSGVFQMNVIIFGITSLFLFCPFLFVFQNLSIQKLPLFLSIEETNHFSNRSFWDIFHPFGAHRNNSFNESYVLVLGSGGLVGKTLVNLLYKKKENVLSISSRSVLDLRVKNCLNIFSGVNIKFCYFLSCEVGGAKYLQNIHNQDDVLQSNLKIHENVFSFLISNQIKFAFASSALVHDDSNYGYIKRQGENITLNHAHIGKVFRLWNAYDFEIFHEKSHIISDLLWQCALHKKAKVLSNGQEKRQFIHCEDIANALLLIMQNFSDMESEIDIANGRWMSIKEIGRTIHEMINCPISFSNRSAKHKKIKQPNLRSNFHKIWNPKIDIRQGIIRVYHQILERLDSRFHIGFIVDCLSMKDIRIYQNFILHLEKVLRVYSYLDFSIHFENSRINHHHLGKIPSINYLANEEFQKGQPIFYCTILNQVPEIHFLLLLQNKLSPFIFYTADVSLYPFVQYSQLYYLPKGAARYFFHSSYAIFYSNFYIRKGTEYNMMYPLTFTDNIFISKIGYQTQMFTSFL